VVRHRRGRRGGTLRDRVVGHGGPHLRINPFWFEGAREDPRDTFFPGLWNALAGLDLRLHWGKLLPHEPASLGLAARYPRRGDFEAVRHRLDPTGRFLTDTWRLALDLGPAAARPPAPLPRNRASERLPPSAGPMPFRLAASDAALVEHADVVFRLQARAACAPDTALRAFFPAGRLGDARWQPQLTWLTPFGAFDDAVFDERLFFMSLRMHVVSYTPGRSLVIAVDRCTWPLARAMVQTMDVELDGDGTIIRWVVALTTPAWVRPLRAALEPAFQRLFTSILATVAARAEQAAP
jgi:hypothetical protein